MARHLFKIKFPPTYLKKKKFQSINNLSTVKGAGSGRMSKYKKFTTKNHKGSKS
jgi:hypothetical protein